MTKDVRDVRLPMARNGFRSGWATAVVDGVHMKVYTSQHASLSFEAHEADVRYIFKRGGGESVEGGLK